MSEIAPATTVTESAPTSTADVASNVIDAFEQTTTSDDVEVSGDTPDPAVETTPAADTPAPGVVEPAKVLSEEEQLLHEFGFKHAFKPDGREHYIARSKVLSMIASGLKRGREKWDGEKTTIESQATELRGHLEQFRTAVLGDPKQFLSELASHDPRYKAFLEPPVASVQQPAPAEMPAPDLPLADGSRTYSLDGLKALLEWNTAQVEARLMPKVDERLKPLTEREQREQARSEAAQVEQAVRQRTQAQMQDAQAWPLFGPLAADGSLTEFQTAVLKELEADTAAATAARRRPTLTLEGAYMKVALPRLTEADNTKRERLLKELGSAPKGTAVPRAGSETPRPTGPLSTQDVAARTLARLERGA